MNILQTLRRCPGALRICSDEDLRAFIDCKQNDTWWHHRALAESLHRAWLFAAGARQESVFRFWQEVWLSDGFAADLIQDLQSWLATQSTRRTFQLPACLESAEWRDTEQAAELRWLLQAWQSSDGIILFVRDRAEEWTAPIAALPFQLRLHLAPAAPLVVDAFGKTNDFALDAGVEAANAMLQHHFLATAPERFGIRLNTLRGSCGTPLKGPSAGLPVLVAAFLQRRFIKPPAMLVGASGVLSNGGLAPADDAEMWRLKQELLGDIGVRELLVPQHPPAACPLTKKPLDDLLNSLAARLQPFEQSLPPLEIERRIQEAASSMSAGSREAASVAWEMSSLLGDPLRDAESVPVLGKACVEAVLTLAAAETHLGRAETAQAHCRRLLERKDTLDPDHLCMALTRAAVCLTDQGDFAQAAALCDEAADMARGIRNPQQQNKRLLRAFGTRGQALMYLALQPEHAQLKADALACLEEACRLAAELDFENAGHSNAEEPRNAAYVFLWHALYAPDHGGDAWKAAWSIAEAKDKDGKTQDFLHRYRWVAGFRGLLSGLSLPLAWWAEPEPPLPSERNERRHLRVAKKYRGAVRASLGDLAGAAEDFTDAASMMDLDSPLHQFIGATAALYAAECLWTLQQEMARVFLNQAIAGLMQHQNRYSGPIHGTLWLQRAQALLEGRSPLHHPQLCYHH